MLSFVSPNTYTLNNTKQLVYILYLFTFSRSSYPLLLLNGVPLSSH